jgi:hypothetical protein
MTSQAAIRIKKSIMLDGTANVVPGMAPTKKKSKSACKMPSLLHATSATIEMLTIKLIFFTFPPLST